MTDEKKLECEVCNEVEQANVVRLYKHDCDKCIYLGPAHDSVDGYFVDLYWCGSANMPTVIARYGDDGPDYKSGIGAAKDNPILMEACQRAFMLGLNTKGVW